MAVGRWLVRWRVVVPACPLSPLWHDGGNASAAPRHSHPMHASPHHNPATVKHSSSLHVVRPPSQPTAAADCSLRQHGGAADGRGARLVRGAVRRRVACMRAAGDARSLRRSAPTYAPRLWSQSASDSCRALCTRGGGQRRRRGGAATPADASRSPAHDSTGSSAVC